MSTYSRLGEGFAAHSPGSLSATAADQQDSVSAVALEFADLGGSSIALAPASFVTALLRQSVASTSVCLLIYEYSGHFDRVLFYARGGEWLPADILSFNPGSRAMQLQLAGFQQHAPTETRAGSRRLLPPDADAVTRQRASADAEIAVAEEELARMRAVAALDHPSSAGSGSGSDPTIVSIPIAEDGSVIALRDGSDAFGMLCGIFNVPCCVWGAPFLLHATAGIYMLWLSVEGDDSGGCAHDLSLFCAWCGLLFAPWLAFLWALVFVHGPIGIIDEFGRSASRKRLAALFGLIYTLGLIWGVIGAVWVIRDQTEVGKCPRSLYYGAYGGAVTLLTELLLPCAFYPIAVCAIVRGTWHRN